MEMSFTCSELVPYASCNGVMRTVFLDKVFLSSVIRDFFKEKKRGARLSACLLVPDQRF